MGAEQTSTQGGDTKANDVKHNETYPIDEQIKQQAYACENELLAKHTAPWTSKEIYYRDIEIDFNGRNYLHTLICGEARQGNPMTKKENLVCLHGYQGNSLSFYRILPLIYENFTSYVPDLIGMGWSSRPIIEFTSTEMCIDFFIDSIEAWRQRLNIDDFYWCGHSLGGYFACLYAWKYPEHVKNIIWWSPFGITDTSKGGDLWENWSWIQKVGFRSIPWAWNYQPRLQQLGNNILTKGIFNLVLRKRYDISPEESELTGMITELTMKYPKDTDECIYYIFKHPIPTPILP